MKYARAHVKCSDALISELLTFKDYCVKEEASVYVLDFVSEVIEGITDVMAYYRQADALDEEGAVYREFMITVPEIVWNFVKEFMAGKKEGFKEIEMFFDQLAKLEKKEFVR